MRRKNTPIRTQTHHNRSLRPHFQPESEDNDKENRSSTANAWEGGEDWMMNGKAREERRHSSLLKQ